MDTNEEPPPPYTPDERRTATFAQVAHRIQRSTGSNSTLQDALAAFGAFLARQENVTLSRHQLKVLKSQCILVLEEMAECFRNGRDISEIMAEVAKIFTSISSDLESKAQWAALFANPSELSELESKIGEAFENLGVQLRSLLKDDKFELPIYRDELLKAWEKDREKIQELEAIIKEMHYSIDNLDACVQKLMEDSLKILGDRTMRQQQAHAKQSLAIIAELTGKSLPPTALVGQEFVTIGSHAIHRGHSYDAILGEYFTGERIVTKVLRHRLDEETARRTQLRFARQAANWSSLRHDAILPFYGIGVAPDPLGVGDYQLYMVSPYLQNQDARRYLNRYSDVSLVARFQMVLDIARGLDYMHEGADISDSGRGIVHSSLDIFNILIKDSGRAVISGFGHSKVILDFQEITFTSTQGVADCRYMAPEVIEGTHLTHGTDVWSWAMTSLEILTDIPPFGKTITSLRTAYLIATGQRPKRTDYPKIEEYVCRDDIWNLFEECWNADPIWRPSAEQVAGCLKSMLSQIVKKPTAPGPQVEVSGHMPIPAIVECLKAHHCLDITSKLDISDCSSYAVAGGGFADVYRGRLRDGRKVAIKHPRLFVQDDQDGHELAAREMYSASKLIHPNIIRVTGLVLFRGALAIISPWMENGVVTRYLVNNPKADRCKLDVSSGLAYMHGKDIVHGDLKGANVLVSGDGVAKISDFGNTILKQYTLAFTGSNDLQGLSMRWTPHELLTDETASTKPSRAADVYALGMTTLEIMTGKVPFHEQSDQAVYRAIREQNLPSRPREHIPVGSQDGDKLWQLITDCWVYEPTKRPPVAKISAMMSKITQKGLSKKSDSGTGAPGPSHLVAGQDGSSTNGTTAGPVATTDKTSSLQQLRSPGGGVQDDVHEESKPAAPSVINAAVAHLDDLQGSLSQLDSSNFQAEQSALESLRRKLSGLNKVS